MGDGADVTLDDRQTQAVRGLAHRVARIERRLGLVTDETRADLTDEELAEYEREQYTATGCVADDSVKAISNEIQRRRGAAAQGG